MEKVFVSCCQYEHDCVVLAKKIKKSGLKFENVFGIPRGGLVLAVRLSHLLNISLIRHEEQITNKTLCCDDLNDGGSTMQEFCLSNIKAQSTAVLYVKKHSMFQPTFYVKKNCDSKTWIEFYYEVKTK